MRICENIDSMLFSPKNEQSLVVAQSNSLSSARNKHPLNVNVLNDF